MNMYEMCKSENSISPDEKQWEKWKYRVVLLLGDAKFDEDFFWALYSDGCNPEYAVAEFTGVL